MPSIPEPKAICNAKTLFTLAVPNTQVYGDGTTDDTAALQNIIDTLPAGSSIYLPSSTYLLNGTLRINKSIAIFGDLPTLGVGGTILKRGGTGEILIFEKAGGRIEGIELRNLFIDGTTTDTADAVHLIRVTLARFDHVTINQSGGNGLYCEDVWDSLFVQLMIRSCGKYGAGGSAPKAGLYLKEPVSDVNNNLKFVGCHFEDASHGQFIISAVANPPSSVQNYGLNFTNCKFESSNRSGSDPSPIVFSRVKNVTFSTCFFGLYAPGANIGYCMEFDASSKDIAIDSYCYNTYVPEGFAKLKDTRTTTIRVRGYYCGGVTLIDNCQQVSTTVLEEFNQATQEGQYLLDFPPVHSIDLQGLARSYNRIVSDATLPHGRALIRESPTSGGAVLEMGVGGNGTMGITLFARVKLASGGPITIKASRDQLEVTLATLSATSSYTDVYCILPRNFVHRSANLRITNGSGTDTLYIAELGWLQGMFYDAPPVDIGSVTADSWLSKSVSFEAGERITRRSSYAGGDCEGWGCFSAGTTTGSQLSGVTGSMTGGSPVLTISTATGIMVGAYLAVAGALKGSRVKAISGTTITMSSNASATVTGAAVTYVAPVFTALGGVNAVSPFPTQVAKVKGISATPTIAAGTGAGTTATVSVTGGSNLAGEISITTGTTTAPSASAVIATITFSSTGYAKAPYVGITPSNAAAAGLGAAQPYITSTSTTFTLNAGTTALTAGVLYKFHYQVLQ